MLKLRVTTGACMFWALMLMAVPFRWCMGAILAASVHELAHMVTLVLLGGRIQDLSLNLFGAKIHIDPMSRGREALSAAAGPIASLLFGGLCGSYPEAALCALAQGCFNLLPIYPLDGGRVLAAVLPADVCKGIELFMLVLFIGLGIWCNLDLEMGGYAWLPLLMALTVRVQRKIPCKEPKLAVQ